MTPQMTTQRRSGFADKERVRFGRHLFNSWILKRAAVQARAGDEKHEARAESLLPLIPIILIALFMLWAVVHPL